jgi:hypothetical protein
VFAFGPAVVPECLAAPFDDQLGYAADRPASYSIEWGEAFYITSFGPSTSVSDTDSSPYIATPVYPLLWLPPRAPGDRPTRPPSRGRSSATRGFDRGGASGCGVRRSNRGPSRSSRQGPG